MVVSLARFEGVFCYLIEQNCSYKFLSGINKVPLQETLLRNVCTFLKLFDPSSPFLEGTKNPLYSFSSLLSLCCEMHAACCAGSPVALDPKLIARAKHTNENLSELLLAFQKITSNKQF